MVTRTTTVHGTAAAAKAAKYQAVAQELSDEFKQRVRAVESKAAAATDGALEAWFQDASSLRDLNEKRFAPVFRAYQEELAMTLEESLRDRIRAGDAGLDDASETEERRKLVGLDLDAIGKRAGERAVERLSPDQRAIGAIEIQGPLSTRQD